MIFPLSAIAGVFPVLTSPSRRTLVIVFSAADALNAKIGSLVRRSLLVVLDFNKVGDDAHHATDFRVVVVNNRPVDLSETECLHRPLLLQRAIDRALLLCNSDATHDA